MFLKINSLNRKFDTKINITNSKSLTIRALLLASIANKQSIIKNFLCCDDTNFCIAALKKLNIKIEKKTNILIINGCNSKFNLKSNIKLFVGSSGITSRFLLALLVAGIQHLAKTIEIIFDGSEQLRNRPIKELVDILTSIGANITYKNQEGFLPLIIKPSKLKINNTINISGKNSSQYVSAVLMMSPLLQQETIINMLDLATKNNPYVKMALQTMKSFGINYLEKENQIIIKNQNYLATNFEIETDLNTASYFFTLAFLTNSRIEIENININTTQPGLLFINLLKKLGAKVIYTENSIVVDGNDGIKGDMEIDMSLMAEMVINVAIIAVFADFPITIYNVKHIRFHETDRIKAICNEFTKLGIKVEEFDDGIKVYPQKNLKSNIEIETYNDHRIAMGFTILGLAGNGIVIDNPACVDKTCPEFFNLIDL